MNEQERALADEYDRIRHQIEHEDNLITQRLSWLMASQSFLFTAYAIVLTGLQPAKAGTPLELSKLGLCHFLPVAGMLSSGLIYLSIWGGVLAIRELRNQWTAHGPSSSFQRPPVQSSGLPFILGQSAPRLLPLAFIGMWLYLLMGNGVRI